MGQVSDIPYPVITSIPSSNADLANAAGRAEPPIITFQLERS